MCVTPDIGYLQRRNHINNYNKLLIRTIISHTVLSELYVKKKKKIKIDQKQIIIIIIVDAG